MSFAATTGTLKKINLTPKNKMSDELELENEPQPVNSSDARELDLKLNYLKSLTGALAVTGWQGDMMHSVDPITATEEESRIIEDVYQQRKREEALA